MATETVVTLTREQLYEQVWETPMRRLAPTYGITDVGLKKVCKKHGVPTPPVGFWAKKEFGKSVEQTPLPDEPEEALQTITLYRDRAGVTKANEPDSPLVDDPDLAALIAFEKDPLNVITVPKSLRNAHSFVASTRDELKSRTSTDQYGLTGTGWMTEEPVFDLRVGKDSIPRALRLVNALVRAVLDRGHRIEAVRAERYYGSHDRRTVVFTVCEERFRISLREKTRMEKLQEKERSWGRNVRYVPKGEFELTLNGFGDTWARGTWKDRKRSPLEDRLNDVLITMIMHVDRTRRGRLAERRREEECRRQLEIEREQERLRKIEQSRVDQLRELTVRWRSAGEIRAFIAAVREEAEERKVDLTAGAPLTEWLTWADAYVRSLDPLDAANALPVFEPANTPPG